MKEKHFILISLIVIFLMIVPPFMINDISNYIYWSIVTMLYLIVATIYMKKRI